MSTRENALRCPPWNKGLLIGQKRPLLPKHVWSIRVRLEMSGSVRDVALFNVALDSKLRACDLVRLRIDDVCSGSVVRERATIVQKETGRPVQFELTEQTRTSIENLLPRLRAIGATYFFPSRLRRSSCLSTRRYARIVRRWVARSAWTRLHTELTPCEGPKLLKSIARQAI